MGRGKHHHTAPTPAPGAATAHSPQPRLPWCQQGGPHFPHPPWREGPGPPLLRVPTFLWGQMVSQRGCLHSPRGSEATEGGIH